MTLQCSHCSLAHRGQEVYQDLYHNNFYVFTIYGLADDAFCDDGNSAILHLKAGDQITVKARRSNILYGSQSEMYSTLTGVQLYTEDMLNINGALYMNM